MASTNLQADSFDIYIIPDVDGDGVEDIYLKAKEKILLIASDITIPIPFQDSESLVITGTGEYTDIQAYTFDVTGLDSTDFDLLFDLSIADFNNDGLADVLLKGNTSIQQSVIVYGASGDIPTRVYAFEKVEGHFVYDQNLIVKDLNNDGRDDITIDFGNSQSILAYATSTGGFVQTTDVVTDANGYVPGALAGDFSVGKDGSANYTIPIAVPIGGAGMQPQLSFSYNSGSGNGYLGMGWNITQSSVISKCGATFIDDGHIDADKYFCLDGNRLVYDEIEGFYHTQQASFSKIVKGSGNTFTVYHKSGGTSFYGNTEGQSPNAFDSNYETYYLDKVEDRAGNKRSYTYIKNTETGEHYLSQISYPGGNVEYKYDQVNVREDKSESWHDGVKTQILKRLERVESKVGGNIYRSYDLKYSYSPINNISRLDSIEECGADDTCLKPTSFNWSELNTTSFNAASITTTMTIKDEWKNNPHFIDINGDGFTDMFLATDSVFQVRFNNGDGTFGDLINTGIDDLSNWDKTIPIDVDSDGKFEVMVPNYSGDHAWYLFSFNGEGFDYQKMSVDGMFAGSIYSYPDPIYHKVIDFNGDGLTDILESRGTYTKIYQNNGDGTFTKPVTGKPIVCANNTIVDEIQNGWNGCNEGYVPHGSYPNISNFSQSIAVDIDADGKQELIFPQDDKWMAATSSWYPGNDVEELGDIYEAYTSTHIKVLSTSLYNISTTRLADLNGDGLADLLYKLENKWGFSINQGGDFGVNIKTDIPYNSTAKVMDYDDDGTSDILYISGGRWHILQSTGNDSCFSSGESCFNIIDSTIAAQSLDDVFRLADFDSDGMTDIVTQTQTQISLNEVERNWRVFTRASNGLPTYLINVTNGFGLQTEFQYGQLFDDVLNFTEFYEKGAEVSYPLRNISGPIRVVKKTQVNKENGSSDFVDYEYKQLVTHMRGLGSLGFKKITATSSLSKVVSEYSHDWESKTHGRLIKQSTSRIQSNEISSGFDLLSETTYKYAVAEIPKSVLDDTYEVSTICWVTCNTYIYKDGGYFIKSSIRSTYLDQKTEEFWEPSSALGVKPFKTITTDYTPDIEVDGFSFNEDFGNMIDVVVTTTTADSSFSVSTISQYDLADTDNWIIGRVNNTQVTSTGTNRETKTRESEWEYYQSGDLKGYLYKEIIEPNESTLKKETTYTYNGLGLKETTTVSGADVQPRSSSTYYDTFGRYAVRVHNALGDVTSTYDPILGLQNSTTSVNGLTSYSIYDGFGRPRSTVAPDGTGITTRFNFSAGADPVSTYHINDTLVSNLPTKYSVTRTDQNGVWSKTYFDQAGKSFETRSLNAFGKTIVSRTEYDQYGHPYRQSEPYFIENGASYWTTTLEKDAKGRPLRIENQEGNEILYSYDGLKVTITNEKGHKKIEEHSVDGKLIKVTDNASNDVIYGYDAAGNMTSMKDEAANLTTFIVYDKLGRKISMTDPDKGYWQYTYNIYGELITQTDAKGQVTCQAYDALGRMVKRIDNYVGSNAVNDCAGDESNAQTATWAYDTAANGLGKVHQVNGANGFSETYEYDSFGRATLVDKVINGENFISQTDYDDQSRPIISMYPSGLAIRNTYNSRGALTEILNASNNKSYWRLESVDHRGKPKNYTMADDVLDVEKIYTDERGFLKSVKTSYSSLVDPLQHNTADYDELANVTLRKDLVKKSQEEAFYDSLNRLEHIDRKVNGDTESRETMSYSHNGNINTKWDMSGTYSYGGNASNCNGIAAGPHAVTSANDDDTYCYDLNGNMLSGAGRNIIWGAFGKPTEISKGSAVKVKFEYGPDRKRIRRLDTQDNFITQTTTSYVGNYEKVIKASGVIDERHYVGGFLVINKITDGANTEVKENYLLKDNLGSVVTTIEIDQLVNSPSLYQAERSSFDAWGKRRNADWSAFLSNDSLYNFKSSVTDWGFTGHEQVDEVGLIHMNGRMYDPILGRFISADPIIQDPTDLQSLNRYSYVRNNPLTLIDPSGFSWISKQWKKWGKDLFLNGVTLGQYSVWKYGLREFGRFARKNQYVAQITQIAGCAVTGPFCGAVVGAVTYAVSDGDFRAAFKAGAIAFVQAGAASGIGGSKLGDFGLIMAHGALGGVVSVAQGGEFGHGFAAGAVGKLMTVGLQGKGSLYQMNGKNFANQDWGSIAARTTIAAISGGVAAESSGGTFANGAVTAAMQHLFNAEKTSFFDTGGYKAKAGDSGVLSPCNNNGTVMDCSAMLREDLDVTDDLRDHVKTDGTINEFVDSLKNFKDESLDTVYDNVVIESACCILNSARFNKPYNAPFFPSPEQRVYIRRTKSFLEFMEKSTDTLNKQRRK